jgi:phage-related protein (TIGR01555 family)
MAGLGDKMSNGQMESIRQRLNIIDRSRSGQNTIMLDSDGGEEYTKLPSTVSGLSDLWDKFSETICATTGIPASRLLGKAPSGLNSSGESDMKNWHDVVSSYREDQIEPCLTWLLEIVQNQQSWKKKPDTFDWTFPALHNPSELELAEIKNKYAEIDMKYADRGAISAAEAWQARFGQGEFQREIKLKMQEYDDGE